MVCSLFGHRECGNDMTERIYEAAERLIKENGADCFFVGNHGQFDAAGITALSSLREKYPNIRCYIVSAYPDLSRSDSGLKRFEELDVIYPCELSLLPRRDAIPQRNKWMVRQSDCVLCCIDRESGGAAASVKYAVRLGKKMFNLGSCGVM